MGLVGKTWFLVVSALYVPAAAGAVAAMTAFAFFVVRAALPLWLLGLHAGGWAAAVAAVQGWRVVRSLRRTRSPQREPFRSSPWAPDLWWPYRFIWGAVLTTVVLAFLAYLGRR